MPASVFALPAATTENLPKLILAAGDCRAQDQRALQVIQSIISETDKLASREGVSMGAFNAAGNMNMTVRSPSGGIAGGQAELGVRYESRDQFKVDLVGQQLWSGYQRAQEQARRGTTVDQQVFVSTLTKEWQGVLKEQVLNKLDLSPRNSGPLRRADRLADRKCTRPWCQIRAGRSVPDESWSLDSWRQSLSMYA